MKATVGVSGRGRGPVWKRAELRVEQLRSAHFIFGVYFAYFGLRIYFGRIFFC